MIKCPHCNEELIDISRPCSRCKYPVNDPYNQWLYGWSYRFGINGCPQDFELAEFWLRHGMYNGNSTAINELSLMYEDRDKNFLENMESEAAGGDVQKQRDLGFLYQGLCGVKKYYEHAINWLEKAAEQGDTISQKELGKLLSDNLPGILDLYESLKWYSAAETEEHSDEDRASVSIRKKIHRGFSELKRELGELDSESARRVLLQLETIDDENQAKDWKYYLECSRKTEELLTDGACGSADIQNIIGDLYKCGIVFPKDYDKAIEWYSKSARSGNIAGQYLLGVLLYNRHLDEDLDWRASEEQIKQNEEDQKQGFELIKKAAKAGFLDAQKKFADLTDFKRPSSMFQISESVENGNQIATEKLKRKITMSVINIRDKYGENEVLRLLDNSPWGSGLIFDKDCYHLSLILDTFDDNERIKNMIKEIIMDTRESGSKHLLIKDLFDEKNANQIGRELEAEELIDDDFKTE